MHSFRNKNNNNNNNKMSSLSSPFCPSLMSEINSPQKHHCPHCNACFNVVNSLYSHVKDKHPGMKYSAKSSNQSSGLSNGLIGENPESILINKLHKNEITPEQFRLDYKKLFIQSLNLKTENPLILFNLNNKTPRCFDIYLSKQSIRWFPSTRLTGKYLRTETYHNGDVIKLNPDEGFTNFKPSANTNTEEIIIGDYFVKSLLFNDNTKLLISPFNNSDEYIMVGYSKIKLEASNTPPEAAPAPTMV